jgi:hypothetical protein
VSLPAATVQIVGIKTLELQLEIVERR